jgi:hypothetical protein
MDGQKVRLCLNHVVTAVLTSAKCLTRVKTANIAAPLGVET